MCDDKLVTDQYSGQPGPHPSAQQQPIPGGAASWDYQAAGAPQGSTPSGGWTPAPKAGLIPLRPLSFGEIFGSTFKLLRFNAGLSIGSALVVQGVTALLAAGLPILVAFWAANRISMASAGDAALLDAALPGWIILSVIPGLILSLIGSVLLQVIIVQVVAKGIIGRKAKLGETLKQCWARFWPIFGYFALYFVVVLVASLIFIGFIALAVWLGTQDSAVAMLIVILVTILLGLAFFVAAVWIGTKLTFAMPAIVLEKMGPIQAIRRSWGLSKGYFWRTFGILLLLQLIIQVMSQVVGGALGFASSILPVFVTPTGGIAEGQEGGLIAFMVVLLILSMLLSILVAAIGQVLITGNAAIMYADLRMRKEGLNIHLQSAVEAYADGRVPEQDPWLAPDLGPLPQLQPYGGQGYPAAGYGGANYSAPGYGAPGYGSQQGYGAQNYGAPNDAAQGYGPQGYGAQNSGAPNYGSQNYGAPNDSGQAGYPQQAPGQFPTSQQAPAWQQGTGQAPAQPAAPAQPEGPALPVGPAQPIDAAQHMGAAQPEAPAQPAPQTYGEALDQQRNRASEASASDWAPMNGAWSNAANSNSPASPYSAGNGGSADTTGSADDTGSSSSDEDSRGNDSTSGGTRE